MSALYFRGKLAYACAFANPPANVPGVLVIMPSRGLLRPETMMSLDELRKILPTAVDLADDRYVGPLKRDARPLKENIGPDVQIVLLGSIATPKYVEPLLEVFGVQLVFPSAFVGRGNMSRGGLLLHCVRENHQLDYIPIAAAVRTGSRPARLPSSSKTRKE